MRRVACVAACAALAALAAPAPAQAAGYTVSACAAGNGTGVNNSWSVFWTSGVNVPYNSSCVSGRGLPNDINQSVPDYANDGWQLTPPADTTITALTATYQGAWDGGTWGGHVDNVNSILWCASFSGYPCGTYPPAPSWWDFYGPTTISVSGSWTTLRLIGGCLAVAGCQGHLQTAWRDISVTITKTTPPSLTIAPGGLASSQRLSGAQQLGWSASDSTGIRRVRLFIDGALATDTVEPCDYTQAAPCGNQSASFTVDTTKLADGTHTWSVEARDATDVNAATRGGSFTVSNAIPGQAQISAATGTNGWLNGAQATTYSPQLTVAPGGPPIAGYAVTTDGTTPGTAVTVAAASGGGATLSAPGGGWPEGTDTIEARAISTSGVAATAIGAVSFRVDRTPPTVVAEGYGDPAPAWQPPPVSVRFVATDALSGVGAADAGAPVTAGGYIAYTVDTGPRQTAAGGVASVQLATQGQHWVTYQGYDVAGNVSQSQTVYVNVGSPTTGAIPGSGFWARSTNPNGRFTAAGGFGQPCPAKVTLAPSRDTYVDETQPDSNYAQATTLIVRSAQGANARTLLDFALPSAGGCAVTSATLSLDATAATAARTLDVFRAGSPWTDTAATWSNRPGPTGTAASATTTAGGWVSVDVSAQIADAYKYGDNGLIVRDDAEDAPISAGQSFGSSEGAAAQEPVLTVTFG